MSHYWAYIKVVIPVLGGADGRRPGSDPVIKLVVGVVPVLVTIVLGGNVAV
jgi:hypothetical protein